MNVKSGTIASLFRCESLPPNEWIQSFPLPSRSHASRAWEALAGKLEKLQELSIECDFDPLPLQVQDLVLSCPNLTTLNLVVDALWDWHEAEITTAIVTGIQSLKNLRHLSITLHKSVTGTFDLDPLVTTLNSSTSRPSLVSLSIAASHIHSSWLLLASLFSETLVSLNFTSFDDDSSEFGTYTTPFLFSGSSFPRLRTLSVSAIRSVTEPLLLSANSTSFPRLNSISFGLNFFDHVDAESMSSANALFAHLRGLAPCAQEISIHDKYWSMPVSVDRIAQRWKSKSSAPGGPSMLEAFVDEESGGPRMAPKEVGVAFEGGRDAPSTYAELKKAWKQGTGHLSSLQVLCFFKGSYSAKCSSILTSDDEKRKFNRVTGLLFVPFTFAAEVAQHAAESALTNLQLLVLFSKPITTDTRRDRFRGGSFKMARKCLINSIPEELKVRIVELIAEADESYKVFIEALGRRTDLKDEYRNIIHGKADTHGKGIKLMSYVSKAWRKLCLPYCFKTLRLTETVGAFWDFSIAPTYSTFFTSLQVPGGRRLFTISETVRAVGQLERLPGITSMSVEAGGFSRLFETQILPPELDNPEVAMAWKALKLKLERLERLEINSITRSIQVEELVPLSSNLKSLKLTSAGEASVGALATGAMSITALKSLQYLCLATTEHSAAILNLSPLHDHLKTGSFTPALQSLSITAHMIHSSWRSLASLFNESLLSLTLRSFASSGDQHASWTPPFSFAGSHFPLLRVLEVSAPRPVSQPILLSCSRSIFPRLSSLSFGLNFHNHGDAVSLLKPEEDVYKHVKAVLRVKGRVYDEKWASDELRGRRAARFDIDPTPTAPWLSEALIENAEDYTDERVIHWREDIPEGVSRAVDYLVNLRDRARERGSEVEWLKLEKLIREAEYDRVYMQI
ncbi:hypothetical protein JCM3765_006956 [Sporobolomyces pararoseus]